MPANGAHPSGKGQYAGVVFDAADLADIQGEARRLRVSVSALLRQAWEIARDELRGRCPACGRSR